MCAKPKTGGLGRGLDALFSQGEAVLQQANAPVTENGDYIHNLPVNLIDTNKEQPRRTFEEQSIADLASSIKQNGLLQPITVTKNGDRYIIVAGERRYRAFRLLGEETIPAIVRNFSRQQSMELALIENLQRKDLDPLEEAGAIASLMQEFGLTQQELSERLGMSRSALANSVRLLQLVPEVGNYLKTGSLTAGHARALLALLDKADQPLAAREIIDNQLNVRQAEALVSKYNNKKRKLKKEAAVKYVELRDYETAVREALGTKVNIIGTPKQGKISIDYYSQDELQGLLDLLISLKGSK